MSESDSTELVKRTSVEDLVQQAKAGHLRVVGHLVDAKTEAAAVGEIQGAKRLVYDPVPKPREQCDIDAAIRDVKASIAKSEEGNGRGAAPN
jgi:hypothetical protein